MANPSSDTSLSLLDQAKDLRSPEAWKELVGLYTPLLHIWLTSAGLQATDRDDIIQRVMTVLVARIGEFQHNGRKGAFRAWLRTIAVHFLKEFHRDRPSPITDSAIAMLSDPASRLSRIWEEQHDLHVLNRLLEKVRSEFTESTWKVFHDVAVKGVPARQVAEEMGMSVNSVFVAKARVLARLRQRAAGLVD